MRWGVGKWRQLDISYFVTPPVIVSPGRRPREGTSLFVLGRVGVWVGGGLPYPSLLSTPVTLTLALSRRAGEGTYPTASPGFAIVSFGGYPRVFRFRWNDGLGMTGVRCSLRVWVLVVWGFPLRRAAPPFIPPRRGGGREVASRPLTSSTKGASRSQTCPYRSSRPPLGASFCGMTGEERG